MAITSLVEEVDDRCGDQSSCYSDLRHVAGDSFGDPGTIAPYGRHKWGERTISVRVGNAKARPREYKFPLVKTALLVLKMQREYMDEGGFGWLLGNDTTMLKEIVPNVGALLEAAREANLTVIHVKESHRNDLSDVPLSKLKRALKQSAAYTLSIGDKGPLGKYLIEGEMGNEFIPECTPLEGEKIICTPGKGVFYGTDLHQFCLEKGISHLIVAGVTTEIDGQQVMRELNDRGFEPVMIHDCTASYFTELRDAAIEMMTAQAGLIGWCTSLEFIKRALELADFEESSFSPPFVLVQKDAALYPTVPILLGPDPEPMSAMQSPTLVFPEGAPEVIGSVEGALPYTFTFPLGQTACIIVDMQRDNIYDGGFGSVLGNDVSPLEDIVPDVQALLEMCRKHGILVVHTMESHTPDLRDCPLAKLTRRKLPEGCRIGDQGKLGRMLINGEWGNAILDELVPLPNEKVIHKPGKGAFCCTELYDYLLCQNITHLIFAGVTTDVGVQTSIFEANDRGFECLLIEDCTESYIPHFKLATFETLTAQGAIIAWTSTLDQLAEGLAPCPTRLNIGISSGEVGDGNPAVRVADRNYSRHGRGRSADTDQDEYHDAVDSSAIDAMTVCDGDDLGDESYLGGPAFSASPNARRSLDSDTNWDSGENGSDVPKVADRWKRGRHGRWRSLSADLRFDFPQDSEFAASPALYYSPDPGRDDVAGGESGRGPKEGIGSASRRARKPASFSAPASGGLFDAGEPARGNANVATKWPIKEEERQDQENDEFVASLPPLWEGSFARLMPSESKSDLLVSASGSLLQANSTPNSPLRVSKGSECSVQEDDMQAGIVEQHRVDRESVTRSRCQESESTAREMQCDERLIGDHSREEEVGAPWSENAENDGRENTQLQKLVTTTGSQRAEEKLSAAKSIHDGLEDVDEQELVLDEAKCVDSEYDLPTSVETAAVLTVAEVKEVAEAKGGMAQEENLMQEEISVLGVTEDEGVGNDAENFVVVEGQLEMEAEVRVATAVESGQEEESSSTAQETADVKVETEEEVKKEEPVSLKSVGTEDWDEQQLKEHKFYKMSDLSIDMETRSELVKPLHTRNTSAASDMVMEDEQELVMDSPTFDSEDDEDDGYGSAFFLTDSDAFKIPQWNHGEVKSEVGVLGKYDFLKAVELDDTCGPTEETKEERLKKGFVTEVRKESSITYEAWIDGSEYETREPKPNEHAVKSIPIQHCVGFEKLLQVVPVAAVGDEEEEALFAGKVDSGPQTWVEQQGSLCDDAEARTFPYTGAGLGIKRVNSNKAMESEKRPVVGPTLGIPTSGPLPSHVPSATALKTQMLLNRNLPGKYREEKWAEQRSQRDMGTKSCGCIPRGFFSRSSSSNKKGGF